MLSNIIAAFTTAGKTMIALEAVVIAAMAAVIVILAVRAVRDRKRGRYDEASALADTDIKEDAEPEDTDDK